MSNRGAFALSAVTAIFIAAVSDSGNFTSAFYGCALGGVFALLAIAYKE